MSQINPFNGAVVGAAQASRQQALQRDREIRLANARRRNSALSDETPAEAQVQNSDAIVSIQRDQQQNPDENPREHHSPDEAPDGQAEEPTSQTAAHIDLKA